MRSTRIPCEIEWYRAVGIFALRLYTGNVETQGVFDVAGLKECPQGLDVMQLPMDQSIAISFKRGSRVRRKNQIADISKKEVDRRTEIIMVSDRRKSIFLGSSRRNHISIRCVQTDYRRERG